MNCKRGEGRLYIFMHSIFITINQRRRHLPERRCLTKMKKRWNARLETGRWVLAVQERRDCFDFISDVVICGIYLSLALGTAKFKQLD